MTRLRRLRLPPPTGDAERDSWTRQVTEAFGDGRYDFRTISSNYSIADTDQILHVDTANAILTLPSAAKVPGKSFPAIKNVSAGLVYVNALGSEIESGTTLIVSPGDSYSVYSDNTDWRIW